MEDTTAGNGLTVELKDWGFSTTLRILFIRVSFRREYQMGKGLSLFKTKSKYTKENSWTAKPTAEAS